MTEGNPLSRKINKILEMRLESDRELVEALKSLSSFFGENSLRNRKNLKSVIERRGLNINKEFLNDFNILKDQIESIRSDVENMNACCTDMTERLKRAKGQTQSLISNTSELRKEGKRIEMCEEAAASFIKKFQLTPTQERVLKAAPTEPLDDDFFAALARVQEIHSKVKILVRSNQQTAGLEIMEEMALYQEKGFERLYRWSQSQTRSLTQEEIEVSMSLQRGMAALSERPILLRYTLDEYAIARKSTIVRGFIDGLTRGTRSQKPIELHSHDPLRYVGDMVAWIHQTSAGERENLTQLIKKCPEHLVQDHKREIMKKIMEGVCRPLKMRVEQILVSEPGPVTLYKLSNLLQFYTQTIQNIIFCHTSETTEGTSSEKPEYDILETLEELSELCKKMFFNSLSFMSQKFTANISKPPLDLSCNQTLKSSLILLKEILSVQDGSILTIENKRNDFNKVLNLILGKFSNIGSNLRNPFSHYYVETLKSQRISLRCGLFI